MAIRSGGKTSGANSTSNTHEHVIALNREPMKHRPLLQREAIHTDLWQKEMGKLNPVSPTRKSHHSFDPMASSSSSSFLNLSSMASSSSSSSSNAAQTYMIAPTHPLPVLSPFHKVNAEELLFSPMASTSRVGIHEHAITVNHEPIKQGLLCLTSGKVAIPTDLLEAMLMTMNNQELPEFVSNYFNASDQFLGIFPELKESVKATFEERTTLTSLKDALGASSASLEQVMAKLVGVYSNQLNMRIKQKSHGDSLDAELDGIDLRKDMLNFIFTSFAAICVVAALVAAKLHPVSVATTAASVVFLAVAKRVDSHHEELKIPVKKSKDISEAIAGAAKFALVCLCDIHALAKEVKFHTESAMKMVDSGAESNVIVTEIEELKRGFQKLETKVDRCGIDADSGRQTIIHTIITNLD